MAKYNAQYPGFDDTPFEAEDLTSDPTYSFTKARWLRELVTADLLKRNAKKPLEGTESDQLFGDLRSRLVGSHPALPILAGDIVLDDPERQKPLVFKLIEPSVKELNDAYGIPGADEFMNDLRLLLKSFFSSNGPEEDKSLGILSEDFKGGVAILNLDASTLIAKLPEISFDALTQVFQAELEALFNAFEERSGGKFHAKHKRLPKPKMVFGSTDWVGKAAVDSTEDLVDSLLLAAVQANTTEERLKDAGNRDRATAAQHSEREIEDFFRRDFGYGFFRFFGLWKKHESNPAWRDVFRLVPVPGYEKEFPHGVPLPSLNVLQLLRKDRVRLKETFDFLTPEDINTLDGVLRVPNRIDVYKPYVAKHKGKFLKRLDVIAELLRKDLHGIDDQQRHLEELAFQAKTSLKNEARERDEVISQTRLAIACDVLDVLDGTTSGAKALIYSDEIGASDRNRQNNMIDGLRFISDEEQGAMRRLVDVVGDKMTTVFREKNEETLLDTFSPAGEVTICSTGGDEGLALVTVKDDFEASLKAYSGQVNARLVVVHLPKNVTWTLEQIAGTMAEVEILAERLFAVQKLEEAKDKENPKSYPVNVIVTQ